MPSDIEINIDATNCNEIQIKDKSIAALSAEITNNHPSHFQLTSITMLVGTIMRRIIIPLIVITLAFAVSCSPGAAVERLTS